MRVILWLAAALAVLWGGYWFVGSHVVESAATDWFANAADQGIVATQNGISVAGFPNRFDLTVTDPDFADPASGWGWKAPFAQVLAMTWKPWHVIAALPNTQQIVTPDQTIELQSTKMQASLRVVPSADLPLAEVVIEGHDLVAKSGAGWSVSAGSLIAALGSSGNDQRLGLDILDLAPEAALMAGVPQLGAAISAVHLDATVTLTAPIDRHVAETKPKVTAINLADLHMVWGELSVSASGRVTARPDGLADGKVDFKFKNWAAIPPLLVAMGLVQPRLAQSITGGLDAMAKAGTDPDVLDLALTFADGRMNFGPLPLGPAPRLN